MTFLQLETILKADGWICIRTIGSTHQFRKVGIEFFVLIPDCKDTIVPIGIIEEVEKKGLSLKR